ncbi:MAG: rod shape-determining protein MreC [Frankiales bacterium]|nr:rod shape-determining protein MreC [Frankiales bacterium]
MRGPRARQLLVVLLLLAITLTALDARGDDTGPLGALRRGSDTVFGPVQGAFGGAVNRVADSLGSLGDSNSADLRRQNDDLRRQVIELQGAAGTQQELADLLRLKDQGSYTTVLARLVGYGTFQPFASTVTIDAGSVDGIKADMTVVNGRGLVGKVVRVGPRTSTVSLLTDPVFSVGARLSGAAGSFGLATGNGDGGLQLRLVELPGGGQLNLGDALVTTGSTTFAPGVPVGRITHVDTGASGQARTATVEPYVDLGSLDLLQVIVDGPRTEPRVAIPPVDPAAPAVGKPPG